MPIEENQVLSDTLHIVNSIGLHARPAAALANAAKAFDAEIRIVRNGREANAKSLIAILGMGIKQGDFIQIQASGREALKAVQSLESLIRFIGEESASPPKVSASGKATPVFSSDRLLVGVPSGSGLALGKLYRLHREKIYVPDECGESPLVERLRLERALAEANQHLEVLKKQMPESEAGIFMAHQELLTDPSLLELVQKGIDEGQSAAFAWRKAYSEFAGQFAGQADELIAARANDFRDVGRRVLRILSGVQETTLNVPPDTILIAEDLTPSDTARLDRSNVCGFCTTKGGATSHVAILARSLNLPAICGMEDRLLTLANGTSALMDGSSGTLRIYPDEEEIRVFRDRQKALMHQRETDLEHTQWAAVTVDNYAVKVAANIGGLEESQNAVALGCDGVGLLRSEFLFLDRLVAPSEEEQARIYSAIANTLGLDKPLVIRTLDVGGDKPLSYLPMQTEENPFLGLRGIRLCLTELHLFRTQIRAILQVASMVRLHIMFPMVSSLEEIRKAKKIVEEERLALGCEAQVKIGIMIEVPSAALLAEHFAPEVDFFSLGTNDLTQYTLAMDRGHSQLAKEADSLHPAVLKLIDLTVRGAHQYGKWVSVCGSMASDPLAVPVLVGLGVDELSVSVAAIPTVKAQIRGLSYAQCQCLALDLLTLASLEDVRAKLRQLS